MNDMMGEHFTIRFTVLFSVAQIVLVVLKCLDKINVSWWVVFIPTIIESIALLITVVLYLVAYSEYRKRVE